MNWLSALLHNQLVGGGFLLMGGGSILALCRNVPVRLWGVIRGRFSVEVEIPPDDPAYAYFRNWFETHPYSKRCRRLKLHTEFAVEIAGYSDEPVEKGSKPSLSSLRMLFMAASGNHLLRHRGRFIWLKMQEEKGDGTRREFRPTADRLFITILGRDQSPIRALLQETAALALAAKDASIRVFTVPWNTWALAAKQPPRLPESVITTKGTWEYLLADAEKFLSSRQVYASLGVPWRRGYLLYGKAGSGKTSVVMALATALGLPIYVLYLSSRMLDDESLGRLLGSIPPSSLLLLEDVDAAFVGRKSGEDTSKGITFSGLLNSIDGVASTGGRIMCMTTNHRELLDSALIRPGRVDVQIEMTDADKEQVVRMFRRFNSTANQYEEQQFIRSIQFPISMAAVQELLLAQYNATKSLTAPNSNGSL